MAAPAAKPALPLTTTVPAPMKTRAKVPTNSATNGRAFINPPSYLKLISLRDTPNQSRFLTFKYYHKNLTFAVALRHVHGQIFENFFLLPDRETDSYRNRAEKTPRLLP
jgi:hypothetical protein